MSDRIEECWRPRPGCCACCPCCRPGATGPAPSSPTRLEVTTRTIRNDVDRLRGLGYPVEARPGVAGGYRLGTGGALPPLLLDDEEAVAVAIGLRTAASGSIAGIEETSVRALAKLQQVLPSRLRHRVSALQSYTLSMPVARPAGRPGRADRDRGRLPGPRAAAVRLPVAFRSRAAGARWSRTAWSTTGAAGICWPGTPIADAWRTFRVDRIEPRTPTGPRFTPRELPPDEEIADAGGPRSRRGDLALPGAGDRARACRVRAGRLPIPVDVESLGDDRCAFEPGSDHPEMLALYLGMLDADFEVVDSPELTTRCARLTGRYQRAVGHS